MRTLIKACCIERDQSITSVSRAGWWILIWKENGQYFRARVRDGEQYLSDVNAPASPLRATDLLGEWKDGLTEAHCHQQQCFHPPMRILNCGYTSPTPGEEMNYEASCLEAIRAHPHPNIGHYQGCIRSPDRPDRFEGFCMKKYTNATNLNDLLNQRIMPMNELLQCREGIEAGLSHLRGLGHSLNSMTFDKIVQDYATCVVVEDDGNPVLLDLLPILLRQPSCAWANILCHQH